MAVTPPPGVIDVAIVAAAVGLGVLEHVRRGDDDGRDDEWTPDGSAAAHARGEISLEEHSERVAAAEAAPPGYRDALERVDGVGPALSGRIRREFPTRDLLAAADREELEAVHGVGPSTADELQRRF